MLGRPRQTPILCSDASCLRFARDRAPPLCRLQQRQGGPHGELLDEHRHEGRNRMQSSRRQERMRGLARVGHGLRIRAMRQPPVLHGHADAAGRRPRLGVHTVFVTPDHTLGYERHFGPEWSANATSPAAARARRSCSACAARRRSSICASSSAWRDWMFALSDWTRRRSYAAVRRAHVRPRAALRRGGDTR